MMEAAIPACGPSPAAEATQQSAAALTPSGIQGSQPCPRLTQPSLAFANQVRKYLAPPTIGLAATSHGRQTPACTAAGKYPGSAARPAAALAVWADCRRNPRLRRT